MREKQVEFEVTFINFREKPDWFLMISPHSKVPRLLIDEQPLFESEAIAGYLDEEVAPDCIRSAPSKVHASVNGHSSFPHFSRAERCHLSELEQ